MPAVELEILVPTSEARVQGSRETVPVAILTNSGSQVTGMAQNKLVGKVCRETEVATRWIWLKREEQWKC